jgi:tryptophan synthase beta chain
VSQLVHEGLVEAVAYPQRAIFSAAITFARSEGLLPAPECAHAIKATIDEALRCKERGEKKVIGFCLSGHGHFDMAAYDRYLSGALEDQEFSEEDMRNALTHLPRLQV